jgi:hypothetical protein
VKLAGFAVVLAAAFAVAALAGGALGSDDWARGDESPAHEQEGEDMTMTSEHGDGHAETAELPGGLSIAEHGYRLAVDEPTRDAGERRELRFRIYDDAGDVVTDFDEEHGALLHLIVVRRDLTGFQHLHPELGSDGVWSVPLELPAAGAYRAFADFETGGEAVTLGADLLVPGRFDPRPLPAPATVARADGYEVEMSESGGMLDFTVSRGGEEVTDLQRYLGARGHLVALREGDLAYLHVHPEERERGESGIGFHAEYPSPGSYRLFLQFRHEDQVHTVEFTEEVHG